MSAVILDNPLFEKLPIWDIFWFVLDYLNPKTDVIILINEWKLESHKKGEFIWTSSNPKLPLDYSGSEIKSSWYNNPSPSRIHFFCNKAAKEGNLTALKWINEKNPKFVFHTTIFNYIFDIDILEWISKKIKPIDGCVAVNASQIGNIEILDWSKDNNLFSIITTYELTKIFEFTINNNYRHMIKWLLNNKDLINSMLPYGMKMDLGSLIAKSGNFELFEWFRSIEKFDSISDFVLNAIIGGNLKILDCISSKEIDRNVYHYLQKVIEHGNINVVKWFMTQHNRVFRKTHQMYIKITQNGYVDVLKWLENIDGFIWTESFSSQLTDLATIGNHLNIVKWLREEKKCLDIELCEMRALENGHFEIFKYVTNEKNTWEYYIYLQMVKNNLLEFLKYVKGKDTENKFRRDIIIQEAFENGRLDIFRFLVENSHFKLSPLSGVATLELPNFQESDNLLKWATEKFFLNKDVYNIIKSRYLNMIDVLFMSAPLLAQSTILKECTWNGEDFETQKDYLIIMRYWEKNGK